MKTIKTVMVPRDMVMACMCDLCGAIAEHGQWPKEPFSVNETDVRVIVRHKEGSQYPDGGWGTEAELDICPKCFNEKLVPWANSQGANIQYEEWDT